MLSNFVSVCVRRISTGSVQLIYEHTRTKRMLYTKLFAASQFVTWPIMAYMANDLYQLRPYFKNKAKQPSGQEGVVAKVSRTVAQSSITERFTTICAFFGIIMGVGAVIFARQTVKSIHVVNRKRIILETHGFLKSNKLEMPVASIRSSKPRNPQESYVVIKVENHIVPFIVDQQGKFPLPKLFDAAIGISRVV